MKVYGTSDAEKEFLSMIQGVLQKQEHFKQNALKQILINVNLL